MKPLHRVFATLQHHLCCQDIFHNSAVYILLIKDHRKINVRQACPVNGSRRYPGAIGLHWMNSKEVLHFDGTHRCLRTNPVHDLNLNPLTIGQNDGNNSSCSFFTQIIRQKLVKSISGLIKIFKIPPIQAQQEEIQI